MLFPNPSVGVVRFLKWMPESSSLPPSLQLPSDHQRPSQKRPPATAKSNTKRPRTTSDREQQATPNFISCFKTTDFLFHVLRLAAPPIWQIAISGDQLLGARYFYRIIYFYNGFCNFEFFSHKTSTQRKILRNYQKT